MALSRIIPHLWYHDQPAALELLERAFGFVEHFSAPEQGGGVHAELRMGRGFVMIGPAHAKKHLGPKFIFHTPDEIDGVCTGSIYVATPDVDALHARARSSGVTIVHEPHDTQWGSRDFSARDAEGYLWNFGTYHPSVDDGPNRTSSDAGNEADVFAAIRYERAHDAIAWLDSAFGIEAHRVFAGQGDRVDHALLRFGTSLVIVSSSQPDDPLKLRSPARTGGVHTQVLYAVVGDPGAHSVRARAAGAEILLPLSEMPWGARLYMALDPEGHPWCFSNYGPHSASA